MVRYVVEYTYGPGSYGKREFSAPATASARAIEAAASRVIPATATAILKIGEKMYIAANNEDKDNRRSYVAQWDNERGDIVILAHEGHPPELGEEVVFEEHFTESELVDLMRSMRDALESSYMCAKRVDAHHAVIAAAFAAARPYPHSDDA